MALSTQALTTLDRVLCEIVSNKPELVESYIEEASEELQTACDRKFYYDSAKVESVPGHGTRHLLLRENLPLVSITSIAYDDGISSDAIDAAEYAIDDAEIGRVRRLIGFWRWTTVASSDITHDPVAGLEEPHYTVTYAGGYVTPQQAVDLALTRTLPYDIERAVVDRVKDLFLRRTQNVAVSQKSVSKASITYGGSGVGGTAAFPPSFQRVIERYRRIGVR